MALSCTVGASVCCLLACQAAMAWMTATPPGHLWALGPWCLFRIWHLSYSSDNHLWGMTSMPSNHVLHPWQSAIVMPHC